MNLKNSFFFIDENRCTIVQNRPYRLPIRPSARLWPGNRRPPVRPPGPGPAEPIYIKLPIDRHGRLLLVNKALSSPCNTSPPRDPNAACSIPPLYVSDNAFSQLVPHQTLFRPGNYKFQ